MYILAVRYLDRCEIVLRGTHSEVFRYSWSHDLPAGACWWDVVCPSEG